MCIFQELIDRFSNKENKEFCRINQILKELLQIGADNGYQLPQIKIRFLNVGYLNAAASIYTNYIDIDYTWKDKLNQDDDYEILKAVIAHELGHFVHFNLSSKKENYLFSCHRHTMEYLADELACTIFNISPELMIKQKRYSCLYNDDTFLSEIVLFHNSDSHPSTHLRINRLQYQRYQDHFLKNDIKYIDSL